MIIRGSETVTLKRFIDSGEVDKYNTPIMTETTITVKNCLIAFGSTNETNEVSRNPIDATLTVYMPKGTAINDDDIVIIRQTEFQKDGIPMDWVSPFPIKTGIVLNLRRRHG